MARHHSSSLHHLWPTPPYNSAGGKEKGQKELLVLNQRETYLIRVTKAMQRV